MALRPLITTKRKVTPMPIDPRFLMPSQQKTALEICAKHGVPSHEFEWQETIVGNPDKAPRVSELRHIPTDYYFTFDFTPEGNLLDCYSPAEEESTYKASSFSYWTTRWEHVEAWAQYLAREIDALQFLATAMHGAPNLQRFALEAEDNQPFSDVERMQVIERLNTVEAHILDSRSFQKAEAQFVRQQFEHLRTEAAHAGRVSWFQMTAGIVVSVIAAFFQGDAARQIWQFVDSQFTQFFRIGQ